MCAIQCAEVNRPPIGIRQDPASWIGPLGDLLHDKYHGLRRVSAPRRHVLPAAAVFLLGPRSAPDCETYGRAADYQSTPATIGTGVTCPR
jgi:hypothetical protein